MRNPFQIFAKAIGYDAVNRRGEGRSPVGVERGNEDAILPTRKRVQLVATQRDAFRNTTFSPATALQLQINVVGTEGGRVSFTTADEKFNAEAGRAFRKWAKRCNFTDGTSLNEILQLLLIQLTHNGGDFIAVFDDGCLTGGRGSGKVRIFESDEIKNVTEAEFMAVFGKDTRKTQQNGIVYDEFGRIIGAFVSSKGRNDEEFKTGEYLHLQLETPGDFTDSHWIFVANRWRVNQGRGVSTATHVTNLLQDLADTQGSEVQAAKLNAGLGIVVTDETPAEPEEGDDPAWSVGGGEGSADQGVASDTAAEIAEIEAAENAALKKAGSSLQAGQSAIVKLTGGKKLDSFKTERPNLDTVRFITDQRIEAGTVFGLPSCFTTLKPEGSYTSARASMVMAERAFQRLRKMLERSFMDWLATRFCVWAGFALPEDFDNCIRWRWPEMMEVDEGAYQTALQKEYVNAVRNLDPLTEDYFIAERARQTEKFHAAGLVAPWEITQAGAQVAAPTDGDTPEEQIPAKEGEQNDG